MKFCDQTVAFHRLTYSECFSNVFIIFSQVIFEHAGGGGGARGRGLFLPHSLLYLTFLMECLSSRNIWAQLQS